MDHRPCICVILMASLAPAIKSSLPTFQSRARRVLQAVTVNGVAAIWGQMEYKPEVVQDTDLALAGSLYLPYEKRYSARRALVELLISNQENTDVVTKYATRGKEDKMLIKAGATRWLECLVTQSTLRA